MSAHLFLVLSTTGARDKKSYGRVSISSHRKEHASAPKVLQPGEDMEAVVADALVGGLFLRQENAMSCISLISIVHSLLFCCCYEQQSSDRQDKEHAMLPSLHI